MARAIALAGRGLNATHPNPRVGCVIAGDRGIVGEGWHRQVGEAHAEVLALEQAGEAARGATAYVSLEPCCHQGRTPPCTDALVAAGIARVVYASPDPDPRVAGGGARQLESAGIRVEGGLLDAHARRINRGFFSRLERGRPWVTAKLAVSLDGRTALASGESRWISGEASRTDVQRLRARSSAILTGIGTVLADDPALSVRLAHPAPVRQPLRVVLDSRFRLPVAAQVLEPPGEVHIFTREAAAAGRIEPAPAGAQVHTVAGGRNGRGVDLNAVMEELGRMEVNELLVEAGDTLNGALLDAGLLDELVIYMASHVLGSDGRGMFAIPALDSMADRPGLRLAEVRRVGKDLRLRLYPGVD